MAFLKKVCKYSRNSFSLEKMLTFTAFRAYKYKPQCPKKRNLPLNMR